MKKFIIYKDISIRKALKSLSATGEKCLIVVDKNKTLLGTLSDGDLRNAILKGIDISNTIKNIYNPNPTILKDKKFDIEKVKTIFLNNKFDIIPVVDKKYKIVKVLRWSSIFKMKKNSSEKKLKIPVVIMAGGKGTRMEPFTKILPKPLVPIHERPVIEHIIDRFIDIGIDKFVLSVNHKSRIMKAYFEELNPNYNIEFIEEDSPLGTAGSLKFLENQFHETFFVTNCDIIIKADYFDLFKFHKKNKNDITLVASLKNYIIPYGTCEINSDGYLKNLNEKPEFDFLINTGLYVLNPEIIKLIKEKRIYHFTDLINDAKKSGKRIGVYPIDDDDWIDVGQWAEYQKAVEQL